MRLSAYPALRLTVPFALGIFFGDYLFFENVHLSPVVMIVFSALFLLALALIYRLVQRYALRTLFGFVAFLGLLTFGTFWSNIKVGESIVDFPSSETVYRAVITDLPKVKERSVHCRAQLLDVPGLPEADALNDRVILLYVAPDSAGQTIRRGDEILFSARLSLPPPGGNPEEFDYGRYLIRKGVSGTAYLASGRWQLVAHHPPNSIMAYASDGMDRLLRYYRVMGFEGDAYAILSALTVGYTADLSESVTEAFAATGVSHVLALSGMHIGFLYLFLLFFLNRLPRSSMLMQIVRLVVVLVVLWAFAILTGLSPSVVRSVVMFSLLALSMFFAGHSISMNTLAVAAFGMLLYDPGWLFDVGFQLSFAAVIAILVLYPWLSERVRITNPILKSIWAVMAVSVVAQIGTMPLTLLYFSRYSVHFLLANIIVVPFTTGLIYLSIVMLLLSLFFAGNALMTSAMTFLIDLLVVIVKEIQGLPFATVDGIWLYRVESLLIYLIIAFIFVFLVRRKPRPLLWGLALILAFTAYRTAMIARDRPDQSIVFYNVRNCPAVHCISPNGDSWLAYADSLPDHRRLTRVASNYWNRLRLRTPAINTGNFACADFVRQDGLLAFGGQRIYIVNDNRWRDKSADAPLRVDFLYLCRGFNGRLDELTATFDIGHLVLDASLSEYRRKALQAECERLGIAFTAVSAEASFFKTTV